MENSPERAWGGISAKLIGLFIAAQLLTLAGAGFGFRSALQSLGALDAISKTSQERSTSLDISAVFKEQVQEWKNVLLRGKDPAMLDRYWQQFQKREEEVRKTAQALKASTRDPATQGLLDRFLIDHDKAGKRYREGLEAFRAAGFDHQKGDSAVRGVDREPAKLLDEAMDRLRGESSEQIAATQAKFRQDLRTAVWVMLACVVVGALLVIWMVRTTVRRPLRNAVDMAAAIGRRDLTVKAQARSADEVGQLLRSFNVMSEGLVASMQEINEAAINVQVGAREIERGNTDLSARTEEHASSLEETAASMEEMAAGVKQTAERTQQASELSKKAEEATTRGQAVFGLTVQSMRAISEGAEKIGDITSVIDSIAFQTNILALNAAVEAARAGEQGKGFAVVAAEVRALAQRSAGAAKEIKALIGSARTESETGTRHVTDAMQAIDQIVGSIRDVSLIIDDISVTAREQAGGVDQVTRAITQMETVTQQNAALVEEAAAAAESMRSQAEALLQLVSTYQLPGRTTASQPAWSDDGPRGSDHTGRGRPRNNPYAPRIAARSASLLSPSPALGGTGSAT